MTNERINFPADIDANASFDELLTLAHDLDLIPAAIDYIFDDAHADPITYLPASIAFMTANFDDAIAPLDDDLFYDRFNNNDLTITFRMIIEMIAAEMMTPNLD